MTGARDDRELKAKHRALWASGDYPAVAAELISELGPELVRECGVRPGDRVLDVATGSGNAAIPAAVAGAVVTASDLTPELFEAGWQIAAARGVEVEWVEADAEAMPFADNGFDVVMSCVGAMFAPHQQIAADELIRVCRPGGTIGMINWTPGGFIGAMFAALRPYSPPLPAGDSPPTLWGGENRVRELLGRSVTSLNLRRKSVLIDHGRSPVAVRDCWKQKYEPVIAAYRYNADRPDGITELDRDLLSFLDQWNLSTEREQTAYSAEYLLVTAVKR